MKKLVVAFSACFLGLIAPGISRAYEPVEWDGPYPVCTTTCVGEPPPACTNGPSIGNSGDCGNACNGGDVWSRYTPVCKNTASPDLPEICSYFWQRMGDSCSTANKCVSGENGLRAGTCACGLGGLYLACCSGSTPVGCVPYAIQDGDQLIEGVCPAGSDQIDCPSGDPTTCCSGSGVTGTPAPTSTPPPSGGCPYWCATADQCYSANGTVHNEYTCSGTDVCCQTSGGGGGGSGCDDACVGYTAMIPGSLACGGNGIVATSCTNNVMTFTTDVGCLWSNQPDKEGLKVLYSNGTSVGLTIPNWSTQGSISLDCNQNYNFRLSPKCCDPFRPSSEEGSCNGCYLNTNWNAPTSTPTPIPDTTQPACVQSAYSIDPTSFSSTNQTFLVEGTGTDNISVSSVSLQCLGCSSECSVDSWYSTGATANLGGGQAEDFSINGVTLAQECKDRATNKGSSAIAAIIVDSSGNTSYQNTNQNCQATINYATPTSAPTSAPTDTPTQTPTPTSTNTPTPTPTPTSTPTPTPTTCPAMTVPTITSFNRVRATGSVQDNLSLSWSSVAGATGYWVEYLEVGNNWTYLVHLG